MCGYSPSNPASLFFFSPPFQPPHVGCRPPPDVASSHIYTPPPSCTCSSAPPIRHPSKQPHQGCSWWYPLSFSPPSSVPSPASPPLNWRPMGPMLGWHTPPGCAAWQCKSLTGYPCSSPSPHLRWRWAGCWVSLIGWSSILTSGLHLYSDVLGVNRQVSHFPMLRVFRSFCILSAVSSFPWLLVARSSAYALTRVSSSKTPNRSSMKAMNRRGDSTAPWGSPSLNTLVLLRAPSNLTLACRLTNHALTHLTHASGTSLSRSFWSRAHRIERSAIIEESEQCSFRRFGLEAVADMLW